MSQHHFDTFLAEKYSVDIAIMINNIDFWLHRNLISGDGIYQNKVWTTFSAEDMKAYFTYWNSEKIRRVLREMHVKDIIVKEQFQGSNRVNSYTFSSSFLDMYKEQLNVYSFFQKETGLHDIANFSEVFNNITSVKAIGISDTRKHGASASSELTLNSYEFGFLKYFEYWNSKENLTTHALPSQVGTKCTKTIKKGIQRLIKITKGEYFTEKKFSNNTKLVYNTPITEELIYQAIDNFALAKLPDYSPENKSGLADSFPDFLYNPRTTTSNLLDFLEFTPTKLHKLEKVPTDIKNKYLSLFGGNISENHKQRLDGKIQALYNVFMNNKELTYFYSNYGTYMGTLQSFFSTHYNYLTTYSEITIGHLNTYGKVWERFKAWLKDNHHIEIEIPTEKFNLMKMRRRQLLIEKGLNTADDFDEHNNLKEASSD